MIRNWLREQAKRRLDLHEPVVFQQFLHQEGTVTCAYRACGQREELPPMQYDRAVLGIPEGAINITFRCERCNYSQRLYVENGQECQKVLWGK